VLFCSRPPCAASMPPACGSAPHVGFAGTRTQERRVNHAAASSANAAAGDLAERVGSPVQIRAPR
jgi:hypothetical protein